MIQGFRGLDQIFVAHFECTLHQAERFSNSVIGCDRRLTFDRAFKFVPGMNATKKT